MKVRKEEKGRIKQTKKINKFGIKRKRKETEEKGKIREGKTGKG